MAAHLTCSSGPVSEYGRCIVILARAYSSAVYVINLSDAEGSATRR